MDYLLTGILLGIALTFLGAYLYQEISHRINHGKKVICNRREAGYVVSCRFNGSKKYFYINEHCERSQDHYYDKKEAIKACREAFAKNRPKQSVFTRVA